MPDDRDADERGMMALVVADRRGRAARISRAARARGLRVSGRASRDAGVMATWSVLESGHRALVASEGSLGADDDAAWRDAIADARGRRDAAAARMARDLARSAPDPRVREVLSRIASAPGPWRVVALAVVLGLSPASAATDVLGDSPGIIPAEVLDLLDDAEALARKANGETWHARARGFAAVLLRPALLVRPVPVRRHPPGPPSHARPPASPLVPCAP